MTDNDKKQFAKIIRATFALFGGESPNADILRMWWALLVQFDIVDIEAAFISFAQKWKFAPKPAEIIELIERAKPDGRPSADEAWAAIPRDEMTSVIMSAEMAEAMQVAQPLLDAGDQVAARMAFRDAYTRIVDGNKRNSVAVKWFPSFGTDKHGRAVAVAEAVQKKRITFKHAVELLPHQHNEVARIVGQRTDVFVIEDGTVSVNVRTLIGSAIKRIPNGGQQEKLTQLREVMK